MADKKVFEAASITSLDFDRTEVDSNSGSGGVPISHITPLPLKTDLECEGWMNDLDSGTYTVIEFQIPKVNCKLYSSIRVIVNFTNTTYNSRIRSMTLNSVSGNIQISEPVYAVNGTMMMFNMIVTGENTSETIMFKYDTYWNHDHIDNETAKVADGNGFEGFYEEKFNNNKQDPRRKVSNYATISVATVLK